jgi:type I restriction enzyme, S subunit
VSLARYKQSELGPIPDEWRIVPLGQLIVSVEYGTSAKSEASGSVPVLRMGNLQGGRITWSDLVFTENDVEIAKYGLISGDVLFNRTNTSELVGKTAIYKGERPAVFAGYLMRVRVDKTLLDSSYLNYVLNAEFSRKHSAKVLSVAVGQANINAQKLRGYPIPLPSSLVEEEAIAEALSDADAFIESLEQLLAKKRRIKQGAMQELLTARRRLPAFSARWTDGTFGSVVGELEAGVSVNSTDDAPVPGMPCVLKTSAVSEGTFLVNECKLIASTDRHRARTALKKNTILISRMNTPDLVGEIGYVSQDYPWLFLPDRVWMTRFRSGRDCNARWLTYLLSTKQYKLRIKASATGTSGSMKNISKPALFSLPIQFPAIAEQTAIAAILSDMDAELAALEAKLTKVRKIKQGMMQELLTGRIRLV